MSRVIDFYKEASTDVQKQMEEVARRRDSFRIKKSQIRHIMFFNGHEYTIKHPETREFFEAINKGRLVGNGFKEVASLRGNDKAYSDNFNQIDWGNNDKTIETEVKIDEAGEQVITAIREIVEDVKTDFPVVIAKEKEQKSFIQKYLKFWN